MFTPIAPGGRACTRSRLGLSAVGRRLASGENEMDGRTHGGGRSGMSAGEGTGWDVASSSLRFALPPPVWLVEAGECTAPYLPSVEWARLPSPILLLPPPPSPSSRFYLGARGGLSGVD